MRGQQAPIGDRQLVRLIYRSVSRLSGSAQEAMEELSAILRTAHRCNPRNGITGVLLYDGVSFLQALEGPMRAVEEMYESIACDQRHEEVDLIDVVPIEARDYSAWSMAYLDGSETTNDVLRSFLSRRLAVIPDDIGRALSDALRDAMQDNGQARIGG